MLSFYIISLSWKKRAILQWRDNICFQVFTRAFITWFPQRRGHMRGHGTPGHDPPWGSSNGGVPRIWCGTLCSGHTAWTRPGNKKIETWCNKLQATAKVAKSFLRMLLNWAHLQRTKCRMVYWQLHHPVTVAKWLHDRQISQDGSLTLCEILLCLIKLSGIWILAYIVQITKTMYEGKEANKC